MWISRHVVTHPPSPFKEFDMNLGGIQDVLHAISITNTVNGTAGDDNVHISKAQGLLGALGYYDVNINGQHQYMTKSELEHTDFELGAGDDRLVVDSNVDASITANGGSGDDTLIGGKGNDWLSGGSGDDYISGGAGNDKLDGGSGDDTLLGGAGDDRLRGGSGDDYLDGGAGVDNNDGGSGNNNVKFDLADILPLLSQFF
jgi:Ca2+-binding RTX toxin-like protein